MDHLPEESIQKSNLKKKKSKKSSKDCADIILTDDNEKKVDEKLEDPVTELANKELKEKKHKKKRFHEEETENSKDDFIVKENDSKNGDQNKSELDKENLSDDGISKTKSKKKKSKKSCKDDDGICQEEDSSIQKEPEQHETKKKTKRKTEDESNLNKATEETDDTNIEMEADLENDAENFKGILNQMDTCKLTKVKKEHNKRKIDTVDGTGKHSDSNSTIPSKSEKTEISEQTQKPVLEATQELTDKCKEGIEYLLQWKKDRKNWSFKKVRQTWLLRNMYDEAKVSLLKCYVILNFPHSIMIF